MVYTLVSTIIASTVEHRMRWRTVENGGEIDDVRIWVVERLRFPSVGAVALNDTGGSMRLIRVPRANILEVEMEAVRHSGNEVFI